MPEFPVPGREMHPMLQQRLLLTMRGCEQQNLIDEQDSVETVKPISHLFTRAVLLSFVLVFASLIASEVAAQDLSPEELKFFESKIRPVLIKECYGCHSNKSGNVRGGLRLDTQNLTHIGGSSGPAIVPGDLEESLLYNAIMHEDFVMPPKRKLPQNVIDDFRQWIEMGAPDPRVTKTVEIKSAITDEDIAQARENFWAYQPPAKSVPPKVANTEWPKSDIDHYILSKLEAAGIAPASDTQPHKLLRRLCFDLVGLPPTPDQIEYFDRQWKQDSERAVAYVVDCLLESDQFGERWGRHWMDVARYAESTGREVNMTYPHAWRYRDYVIDSFNADKPFNEFVQEQIAGDLIPTESDEEWASNLVATTFLAMGPKNVNEQNRVQFAADVMDEQIDATTRVFMGMSVACSRCHDHKFDAIPQSDYYALAGIFKNATSYWGNPPSQYGTFQTPQRKQHSSLIRLPVDDPNPFDKRYTAQELADLKRQLTETMEEAAQSRRNRSRDSAGAAQAQRNRIMTANKLAGLSDELSIVDDQGKPISYTMGVQERSSASNARILVRGEIDQPGQTVPRGFPQVLCETPVDLASNESGRLELARWIGSDRNTLTARVMVNRIWQHLIGHGIVSSTENFGVTGQAPSHPELLDHLAIEFVESGWSIKSMVRQIATSRVYRMQSTYDEQNHEYDPDNALLWRANPRRLDAEAIRDAMLAISGQIDLERPRASEVAKAGFKRVRDGVLGDARESMRKVMESVQKDLRATATQNMRGRGRGGFRQSGPGRVARGRGSFTSGADRQAAIEKATRSVRNQLDMEDSTIRSVYLPIVRDEVPRALEVFDFADASSIVGVREASNTPNQALFMMNNPFVIQQSDAFARRIAEHSSQVRDQIEYAFLLAYGRLPTSGERQATSQFVREFNSANYRSRDAAPSTLAAVCQGLFASAEFRLID